MEGNPKPSSPFTEAEQAERRRCLERLYEMRRNEEWPAQRSSPEFLRLMYEWAEMPRPLRAATNFAEIDEYDIMWWAFFKGVMWGTPEERIAQLESLEDPRAQAVIAHIQWVIDGPLPVEPQRAFYMSYWPAELYCYVSARLHPDPVRSPPPIARSWEQREESLELFVPTGLVCPACRRPFGLFDPQHAGVHCQACGHRWLAGES